MGIKLGDRVIDGLTGFNGVVTARAEYLNCGPRMQVERCLASGQLLVEWLDEVRLKVIPEGHFV